MSPRKCSRENCPPKCTSKDQTTCCYRCKDAIHLLCYGINKTLEEIFVTRNVVILCDECMLTDLEEPSPKRKGNAPNLVQRTLDGKLATESPSTKSVPVKPPSNKLIESLSNEIKMQTATITALKSSVDSMHHTIAQQKETFGNSSELNDDHLSSIKNAVIKTHDLIASIKKPTIADVVKGSINNRNNPETPRSRMPRSIPSQTKAKTPSVPGKSNDAIGKPLSPNQFRPAQRANRETRPQPKKILQKAVWISRLHRDTTEDDILTYIRDKMGIVADDQLEIRKLVKKDRELTSYSFISFRVSCSEVLFETLIDANRWPSTCTLREFVTEPNLSNGVRLNGGSPKVAEKSPSPINFSKNSQNIPPENQIDMTSRILMETES